MFPVNDTVVFPSEDRGALNVMCEQIPGLAVLELIAL